MIARLQLPPVNLGQAMLAPGTADHAAPPASARGAWIAGLLGFLSFMPYAAIAVGNTTAVQAGSLIALLIIVPVLIARKLQGPLWVTLVLIVPLVLSAVKVAAAGDDLDLCLKTVLPISLALVTLAATQICAPQYAMELMTGIAIATVLHVLVGAWQYYCFQRDEFPFPWLYVNQSFLSVQDSADIIATYVQRPFGIFPEPSAMSSSLAPWVLFWIAEMCGIVRLRRSPRAWQRMLFAVAAIGALALIILSRSGHAAVTMAAVVVFVAIWFSRCRASRGSYAAVIAIFGIALPVALYFAATELGDRLGGQSQMGNGSWEDRSNSLLIGFDVWTSSDVPSVIFGVGAGLMSPVLRRIAHLEAVWSVLLNYIYETGLVGALTTCWVGVYLARIWKTMRFNPAFIGILLVWLVGVTVTTSYDQLLTLWVALGWMTVWPAICHPEPQARIQDRRSSPAERLTPMPITIRALPAPATGALKGWRARTSDASDLPDGAPRPAPAPRRIKRWSEP